MRSLIVILLSWCISTGLYAQTDSNRLKVEDALLTIEDHYQVRFSYSKNIVPSEDLVALGFDRKTLIEVLEDLGSQTGIIYRQRGTRVVLNYDPLRKADSERNQVLTVRGSDDTVVPDIDSSQAESIVIEDEVAGVGTRTQVDSVSKINRQDQTRLISHSQRKYEAIGLTFNRDEKIQWAQVSFVPARSLFDRKGGKINHFSFNILAGYTGGLQGIEIGGFANAVKRDVKGFQLAGFANYIGGNVEGIQVAGFSNYDQGIMRGLQIAGMANVNVQTDGVQIAGGFNLNRRISRSYQLAGLFNAGRNVTGGQVAGFFNLSLGSVYFQTSGFCNVAENADVQIAGLINVAKKVNVLQLGLINIADTVSGFSFGLLNLIKRGYNKVEISMGDAIYGNLAVKLGTRHFYNIFQVGTNFKRNIPQTGLIWTYGYGFGFFQNISKGLKLNPEILVSNVQESHIIKPELNLLNQFKVLFHFGERNKPEIFAGPTFNLMISKITLENGLLVGSGISSVTLFERNFLNLINPVNTKFWIGFNAGIRI